MAANLWQAMLLDGARMRDQGLGHRRDAAGVHGGHAASGPWEKRWVVQTKGSKQNDAENVSMVGWTVLRTHTHTHAPCTICFMQRSSVSRQGPLSRAHGHCKTSVHFACALVEVNGRCIQGVQWGRPEDCQFHEILTGRDWYHFAAVSNV